MGLFSKKPKTRVERIEALAEELEARTSKAEARLDVLQQQVEVVAVRTKGKV